MQYTNPPSVWIATEALNKIDTIDIFDHIDNQITFILLICITLVVFVSKVVIIMVQVLTLTKERIDNKKKKPSEVKKENYYILLLWSFNG